MQANITTHLSVSADITLNNRLSYRWSNFFLENNNTSNVCNTKKWKKLQNIMQITDTLSFVSALL